MNKSFRDALWGVFFCVLAVAIFVYSNTFDAPSEIPLLAKSAVYAKIWAGALFILALVLLIRSIRTKDASSVPAVVTLPVFLSAAALAAYVFLLEYLGFIVSTILFMTVMITYYHWLSLQPEEKSCVKMPVVAVKYLLFSVLLGGVFYLIFGQVLGVYLPLGSVIESFVY